MPHALQPVGAFAALGAAATLRVFRNEPVPHCHPAPDADQDFLGSNQKNSDWTAARLIHDDRFPGPSKSFRTLRSSNRREETTAVLAADQHVSFAPRCMLIWQETKSVHLTSFIQGPHNTSEVH